MASSSQSGAASGAQALAAYRDAQGFLPLVDCSQCGTRLIGRISQQANSKGKRFYKCPMLEHTDLACPLYMCEEHYVEFLVKEGLLPACFSMRGIRPDVSVANVSMNEARKDATEHLGKAVEAVGRSITSLDNAITSLKDAQNAATDRMGDVGKKVDRLGEIVVFVGLANLLVLVLVLLVLLVK